MLFVLRLLLFLFALYLFLTAPNIRRRKISRKGLFPCDYAHRGLHDPSLGIPENSLAAFRRAVTKGFGIELDVHLTRDQRLVVIHDHDAERMCGIRGKINEMTLEEVRALRLNGTDEGVPTLDEALAVIGGRVPLLMELKSPPEEIRNTAIAVLVNARMQSYDGPYCVESFNPLLLRWYKKHAPGVTRGQLACDSRKMRETRGKNRALRFMNANLLFDFLSRPDFIAYGHLTDRNLSYRLVRNVFRPMLAAWTVRGADEYDRLSPAYDSMIFEGFIPQK